MPNVLGVYTSPKPHWVGDGFPVRSMFSHATHGPHVAGVRTAAKQASRHQAAE